MLVQISKLQRGRPVESRMAACDRRRQLISGTNRSTCMLLQRF